MRQRKEPQESGSVYIMALGFVYIIAMVNAGSKGSPINIAQIMACVGQQNVEGS